MLTIYLKTRNFLISLLELRKANIKLKKAFNFIQEQNDGIEEQLDYTIQNSDKSVVSLKHFCDIYQMFYSKNFDDRATAIFDEIELVSDNWKETIKTLKKGMN